MRFLTDECVSPTTVYRIACQQKRVIVTTDKGFRLFDPARCGGIIISTIRPNTPVRYEPRLKHLLTTTHLAELTGALVLLEEKRHRLIKR